MRASYVNKTDDGSIFTLLCRKMLKDYEIDDDGVICILSDNPRKKRLRILSTALNLERIPLIGFGTYYAVQTPQVIYNALSVGYRHLDLAENYNNLKHVNQALLQALASLTEGGLGIERKDIWITMKIPVQSINNISAILDEVGTDYFDLLLYHYPFSMFDSKAQLRESWLHMTMLKQSKFVKRIGVSNFYASHLTKLFDVCQEFNLENRLQMKFRLIHMSTVWRRKPLIFASNIMYN